MTKVIVCQRCGKAQTNNCDISVVLDIYKIRVTRGFIKTNIDPMIPYFPLEFDEKCFGEIDICKKCLDDFIG